MKPEPKLPLVFVGSSSEALRAAQALSNNLRFFAFSKPWNQNNFELSKGTLESLIKEAPTYDFAVFILAPDDVRRSRKVKSYVPRDNVIFEIGLFMGVLGRERVFLVKRRDLDVDLPSDFAGITTADYVNPPDGESWEAALTYASTAISDLIKQRGFRASAQEVVTSSEAHLKDAAQYFDKLLIDRYGVSAVFSGVNLTVTSLDGSATIRRTLQGIKVSGPIKIDQIPGGITPGTRAGRIIKHPTFLKKVKFKKPVFLSHKEKTDRASIFDVVVKGSLTQNDPKLDYEYECVVSKAFLMVREAVEKAYKKKDFKYEYISLRVEMPTDKAKLEISFPKGFKVEAFPGVFFGESESMHDSELTRVDKGFRRQKYGATFVIRKPVVGFNYIIYWVSPTKRDSIQRKT